LIQSAPGTHDFALGTPEDWLVLGAAKRDETEETDRLDRRRKANFNF